MSPTCGATSSFRSGPFLSLSRSGRHRAGMLRSLSRRARCLCQPPALRPLPRAPGCRGDARCQVTAASSQARRDTGVHEFALGGQICSTNRIIGVGGNPALSVRPLMLTTDSSQGEVGTLTC
ncbi:hypothetical protein AAFF_G00056950 [Aldrovandia affinis]|uniref:Uncharacterized protein n=1 Tax=Aldrovandia affinis TaxID=143900 RepID=A0AAD7WEL7_9TELE|nr:hypothetical protein AAFF_G00056950 [Aldrovandia affinis]